VPRILILTSDQGGGHRAAANALVEAIGRLADAAVEVVDFLDLAMPGSSAHAAWVYRTVVNHAPPVHAAVWRLGDRAPWVPRALARVVWPLGRGRLRALLTSRPPDCVVSVYPLANHETARVLASLDPRPPFVNVVTDLGNPPSVWFASGVDLHVVPCEGARQRARRAGVPADRLQVVGLPLAGAFVGPRRDRADLRAELGLDRGRRMILLIGGGEGMGRLAAIGAGIAGSGLDAQLVIVAGRNEPLRRRLAGMTWTMPTSVHGFVDTMPLLMGAADVVVTKAGPHTVMEAVTFGCPLILSGFVPAQEEGVVRLVLEAGAGILADTPAKVVDALRTLFGSREAAARMAAGARRLARPEAAQDIARLVLRLAGERRSLGSPGAA